LYEQHAAIKQALGFKQTLYPSRTTARRRKKRIELTVHLNRKKNNQVSIEFIEKKTRENEPVVIDIKL